MKKKLFLALLTTLLLLLAATTALAVSPSDYNCLLCGEPCTEWYSYNGGDGTISVHSPACYICNAIVWDTAFPCTPAEGTATCDSPALCSVCGSPDWIGSAPDPNAHGDMSRWFYTSPTQHYRYCLDCCAEASYEYEDHYGGTATCSKRAICEGCGHNYGELSTEHAMSEWESISTTQHRKHCTICWALETIIYEDHYGGTATCWDLAVCEGCGEPYGDYDFDNHDWGDWVWLNGSTHVRECRDCPATEEGTHTGGTATCITHAICEVCTASYGELDSTRHGKYSGWSYYDGTRHCSWCLDCSSPTSIKYEDHYGGTATCVTQAFCEGCSTSYGELSDKHLNMSDWFYVNTEQHFRYCRDCFSSDSYEYEDHYGGDGSCRPTCEGCGNRYYDADGEHRSMSDWAPVDDTEHYRFCLDCGKSDSIEYEDHYGGTATCTQKAVCEGCGAEYGALSDVHPWGEWKSYDSSGHRRYCTNPDCDASEYANHSGSGDSCRIECEDCGDLYMNAEGQHLTMSVWYLLNDTQHMRHCLDCGYGEQYEDHTGGTATCTEQAVCEVCSEGYGKTDPNNHVNMSDWHTSGASQHSRYCLDCFSSDSYEYEDHYGGTATCTQEAVCEGCGGSYGELSDEHLNMSDWQNSDALQHRRYCLDCASPDSYEYEDHYGGTASCRKYAVCEGCGESYGEYDPNNHVRMSDWLFRNASQHYRYCPDCASSDSYEYEDHYGGDGSCRPICEGCGERYYDADGEHRSMSDWACYDDTQHYRYCLDCTASNSFELAPHTGGTATCTELAVCEFCSTKYGVPSDVHPWGEWEPCDSYGHRRYCTNPDCNASEYADHSGGDGSCRTECEDCGEIYTDEDGKHRNMSDWGYADETRHSRICLDCGEYTEYAPHTSGDGSCMHICEDCGEVIYDLDGEHRNISNWFLQNDTQHYRFCLDCGDPSTYEYADHTDGDGSCKPTCEDCGEIYYNADGEHRAMSNWRCYDDTQHYRVCTVCYYTVSCEYAPHTGGTATCWELAVCEGCGASYGDYDFDNHDWGDWEGFSASTHIRVCRDCKTEEEAPHTGGDGSCFPTCEECGWDYLDPDGEHRNMCDWFPESDTQHRRYCLDCNTYESNEYENHYGGTATCSAPAICEGCGAAYGELDGTKHGDYSDWEAYDETQHYRFCLDCGANEEYEDHYGGTATCSSRAICEGCGISYGDLALDVHLHMSEWRPYADGHERHCLDCRRPTSIERAPHTGDGTCQSACIDCHENFIDPNGEHHLTDWLPVNGTQHFRYCDRCYGESTYEYADHVGDGTCTSECKDCGMAFTDPDGTHRLTEWRAHSSKQHIRYCPDCELERTFEYGEHRPNANAEDLPCNKPITCADCRYIMGWGTQHSLSDWVPYSTLQHIRYCIVGGIDHMVEYDLHYGGTATCSELAVCEGCGDFYGDFAADAHAWGEWKPDANGTHTRVCTLDPTHTETADCTWGDWTHLTHIHHERRCTVCNGQELGEHTGGTPTCHSPRICDVCNEGYGSPDNSGLSGHPNPVIEQKPATCYDEGYYRITCDHPGCSMPFFEIILPSNGQHLYNHWDILGDHQHHTDCAQCSENVDVACTLWGLYDGETLLTVCPVCGAFGDTLFEIIFAREDVAVPIGTLLVRGAEAPCDGAMYGVTVAGVYGGEVVNIHGEVTITLPIVLESFTLVRVDVTDGVETRTEVPFTLENGQLTFSTDAAGLFLLVPAE